MNFQELLAKMQELDRPATEACGDSPMPMGMPPMPEKPDTPPPTMSINLNAQGLDNIEELMKLVKSVNPDMDKPESPISAISIEPMDKPMGGAMGGLPPLKMLPDMDSDNDSMPGGEIDLPPGHDSDHAMVKALDRDDDGDHDMDDHDAERKDKDEAFGNSVGDSEPEYNTIADIMNKGNDLNKPKKSFSGKPYRGDNPMAAGAYESKEQLRASIREELLQRLAEAKGAK